MEIIQFEDKELSHYSYSVISNGEMALIDPGRDPQPYYDLAHQHQSKIIAVIETHPHADFVSSHLEIHKTTGAVIYVSKLLEAQYEHETFDEGDCIAIGNITLKALNTPGHSPDSICVLAINANGKEEAVFTGDTLFIGDCGRPDLRESPESATTARTVLARQMYHSLREQLLILPDEVLVYPAHGAGSLCGKGLSEKNSSTVGIEKAGNWSLQESTEDDFVKELLAGQPFIPKYFSYDVGLNKKGAGNFAESIAAIKVSETLPDQLRDYVIIDSRDSSLFNRGHLKTAINLMNDTKFETWLGSIIAPGEKFYLIAEDKNQLQSLIKRVAKIGYEHQIEAAFAVKEIKGEMIKPLDISHFKKSPKDFTVIDVRNPSEVKENPLFTHALNFPLYELREHANEIPTGRPVVVHCIGGYRSAAGASIIKGKLNGSAGIYDLGEAAKTFYKN